MILTPNQSLKFRTLNDERVLLDCGSVAEGALRICGKRRRLRVMLSLLLRPMPIGVSTAHRSYGLTILSYHAT